MHLSRKEHLRRKELCILINIDNYENDSKNLYNSTKRLGEYDQQDPILGWNSNLTLESSIEHIVKEKL